VKWKRVILALVLPYSSSSLVLYCFFEGVKDFLVFFWWKTADLFEEGFLLSLTEGRDYIEAGLDDAGFGFFVEEPFGWYIEGSASESGTIGELALEISKEPDTVFGGDAFHFFEEFEFLVASEAFELVEFTPDIHFLGFAFVEIDGCRNGCGDERDASITVGILHKIGHLIWGLSGIIGESSPGDVTIRLRKGLVCGGAKGEVSGKTLVDVESILGRITVGMVNSSRKSSRKNPRIK
jgi:hypothetical protein